MWLNNKLETVSPNIENRVHWKGIIKGPIYSFWFWLSMPTNLFPFEYSSEKRMESMYVKIHINIASTIKINACDLVKPVSTN